MNNKTYQGVSDLRLYYSKYKLTYGVPEDGFVPLPYKNNFSICIGRFISLRFNSYTSSIIPMVSYMSLSQFKNYSNKTGIVCNYLVNYSTSLIVVQQEQDIKLIFCLDFYKGFTEFEDYIVITSTYFKITIDKKTWKMEVAYVNSGVE